MLKEPVCGSAAGIKKGEEEEGTLNDGCCMCSFNSGADEAALAGVFTSAASRPAVSAVHSFMGRS